MARPGQRRADWDALLAARSPAGPHWRFASVSPGGREERSAVAYCYGISPFLGTIRQLELCSLAHKLSFYGGSALQASAAPDRYTLLVAAEKSCSRGSLSTKPRHRVDTLSPLGRDARASRGSEGSSQAANASAPKPRAPACARCDLFLPDKNSSAKARRRCRHPHRKSARLRRRAPGG